MTSRLVSAPIIALATAGALSLVLAAGGHNPVWRAEPLNLPEAAALRDLGEVARLLALGADPHAERPVRPGFLYRHAARLTPLEAAVRADRPEIVQLLFDYGLSLDAHSWHAVWCLAASGEMRRTLSTAQPPGSSLPCASGPPARAFAKE